MKSTFAVLVIVFLGMSAPMFANGVQVDFTIVGDYFLGLVEGGQVVEEVEVEDVTFVLSICYDPNTPGVNGGNIGFYEGAIQNWSVSAPFGLPTLTFVPDSSIIILVDDPFSDIWFAEADGVDNGNAEGEFEVFMESEENPLDGVALVPPWSLASFDTDGFAEGEWEAIIESDLIIAEWGGEITDIQVTMKGATGVPEPGTLLLLGSGLLVGAAFRKRL